MKSLSRRPPLTDQPVSTCRFRLKPLFNGGVDVSQMGTHRGGGIFRITRFYRVEYSPVLMQCVVGSLVGTKAAEPLAIKPRTT